MSLPTDVLARSTPTRLICRGGRWVLELTRLEAVDRDVFQPRLQRLEGAEPILALLRRSEEGQHLATGAAQLMRNRADDDRAFDANEGDWVPSSGPVLARHDLNGAAEAELTGVIAELRAELVVLRASHTRLRERVMALEAAQSGLGGPQMRPPRGSRVARRSEPPLAVAPVPATTGPSADAAAFAATQASPAHAAKGPAAADTAGGRPAGKGAATEALPPTFAELAQAFAGDQLPPVLGLPSLSALNQCMGTLMESAPALEASASEHALSALGGPKACKLLDDEGRECGVILLDLRAAVRLGAALLALPPDEAQRQLDQNDASEDALLAMSEICNNLTAPINAVAGNRHVRATALDSVDVAALPALRARLDLDAEGGRVVLGMF